MDKDQTIAQLKAVLGDEVTEAQIDAVLAAQVTLTEGDPVGTIRRDKESGKVAHRVKDGLVVQWRVSGPDGEVYNDLQPTLPWEILHAVG